MLSQEFIDSIVFGQTTVWVGRNQYKIVRKTPTGWYRLKVKGSTRDGSLYSQWLLKHTFFETKLDSLKNELAKAEFTRDRLKVQYEQKCNDVKELIAIINEMEVA